MQHQIFKDIIESYVLAYNNFDVEAMLKNFHQNIIFKNIVNQDVNMLVEGIDNFRKQAESILPIFSEREQKITNFEFFSDHVEVLLDYRAILAVDLGNMKKDDTLQLKGKSIFYFLDNQIIELQDII